MKKVSQNHEIAKRILDNVFEMYKRKNADYGNSFGEQYAKHGDLSYIIRKDDKSRRFEQLCKQDAQVVSESKEDTVMDSIGYDLLWLIEQEKIRIGVHADDDLKAENIRLRASLDNMYSTM